MPASQLIRQDLVPMVAGYLIIMVALAIGLRLARRPAAPARRPPGPGRLRQGWLRRGWLRQGWLRQGWARLARHAAATAAGGYLLLMAVVILYYYGVARVGGQFLKSAFTGCAMLIGVATPVFTLASWLVVCWGRKHPRKAEPPATR